MKNETYHMAMRIVLSLKAMQSHVQSKLCRSLPRQRAIAVCRHATVFAMALASLPTTGLSQTTASPTITSQPADLAIASGAAATFVVSAAGTLPLNYQWRLNATELNGATNRILSLQSVQQANAGVYTVDVGNLAGTNTSRAAQLSVGEPGTYTNSVGARLPYRLFPPENYDPSKKYPLVVFWNGSGSAGTDNLSQLYDQGQFVFLSAENRAKNPCFFLCPQFPTSDPNCDDNLKIIDAGAELIDSVKAQLSIDPDRVYMTGLSFGGYYTWIFAARHSNLMAAVIPMSGGWLCHTNFLNIRVPVWNFHAANDTIVSVFNSDSAVDALRNVGGNPIYTRFPSGGHNIWPMAYRTPTLVDWLMAQRRGALSPVPPVLTIALPSPADNYVTSATAIDISGSASHYADVLQVAWTNTTLRAGAVAGGTNDWYSKGVPLRIGTTNIIVMIGRGTSHTPDLSSGGDTTFSETLSVLQFPLRVTNVLISADGQSLSFTWSALPAKRYRVQYKNDLSVPDWSDLPVCPIINGSTQSIKDVITAVPQRFYRLLELD
jgi:poly(3-hydroxybutyrate) depolymerase